MAEQKMTSREPGGPGPGGGPGRHGYQKPKDLRGTLGKLMHYLGQYKALLFAVVVLAIAAVLLAVRSHNATGGKLTAQLIYGDANAVMDIPLEKDETYSVDTGYYTVHIEVKDGRARFIESPCPDHICEGFGWLSAEDQTATCLPARAVLTIVPVG